MFYKSAKEYLKYNKDSTNFEKNNKIRLKGEITSDGSVSRVNKIFKLKVYRKSCYEDEFNIYMPIEEIKDLKLEKGCYVDLRGEIRTMKRHDQTSISVKAESVEILDEHDASVEMLLKNKNECCVIGFLTRNPHYNVFTNEMFQTREVTDCVIAVQDPNSKDSSYIPFVTYGKDAYNLGTKCIKGDKLMIEGRFQPRKYIKDGQEHVTYEINAKNLVALNENNCKEY